MMKFSAIFLAMIVFSLSSVEGTGQQVQLENVGLENCNCIATYDYRPMCASNGVTYSNPSMLICAQRCLNRSDVVKVHDGHC